MKALKVCQTIRNRYTNTFKVVKNFQIKIRKKLAFVQQYGNVKKN